jgi:UDPglucose 6-dehydrogenase
VIGFAGLTHLGAVSSIATASKGFRVVAYDPDPAVCQGLNEGQPPVFEPDLAELLADNRERIEFSSDPAALKECELIFFSLDVPTDAEGHSDLSTLNGLIDTVVPNLAPGAVLIILSQVPPGFTRSLAARLYGRSGGLDNSLFHQVETLVIGSAVEKACRPERFIVGCGDAGSPLPGPYAWLLDAFDCPVLQMGYESAEVAKVAVNLFLASSVTMSNTLAELCENIGGEWSEVIPALRLDKRIGRYAYLNPGLGLSGGHLERDLATVSSLASRLGTDKGAIDACVANSLLRRDWALKMIQAEVMPSIANPNIAVWGLAYKPGTESTTNSPAINLIEELHHCTIRAYDPQAAVDTVQLPQVVQTRTAWDACAGSDVLAVMTPWPEFSSADLSRLPDEMKGRVIIDPFGALDREICAGMGFSYFRLGSPLKMPQYAV